ncbi:SGNH/GDSL hydrolase family protein [Curtobacterium sp. MCBA15_001]|uniref:SGNH/GDSL hydrolase family protein n=1 Tax=Curtobacterium sp. MCBA15_001 TaxID=1898731 RepID=UPI001587358C|nr:SGNH/GDSL hydrolase family protein [Curtobacterium sp. MCBA15_001]
MRTRHRTLLAATAATLAVLALGACSEDSSVAAPRVSASATTAASRPWDHAPHARIVVVGDSISGGHGLTDAQAWPALLADEHHWALTNLSCDGAGVAAVGDDDDCASAYPTLVKRAVELRPAVVFVQASSNDLGMDDAEIRSATNQVVADVHRRLPEARLIGLSAIWNQDAPPAQLAVISKALRKAIRHEGGQYVDIGEPLRGHQDWMQSDDVHPTVEGQQAIASDVAAAFAKDHVRF